MKKRFLSFIIAFALVLAGAMYLTACDGDTPKEPPSEKTLSHITCEVHHPKFSDGQFNYTCGEEINIVKDDFTVTAHYSDNTTEAVTDFVFTPEFPNGILDAAGSYKVTVSYSSASSVSYNVVVVEKKLDAAVKTVLDAVTETIEVDYTGETINVIDKIEGLSALLSGSQSQIAISEGTASATDTGTYSFTVSSVKGYEKYSKTINWKIVEVKPTEIAVPAVTSVEYDGNEHGIVLEFAQGTPQEAIDSITNYSESFINKKHTDAGTYDYVLEIKSDKYVFADTADGNRRTAAVTFTITKKSLGYNKDNIALTKNPTYKGRNLVVADLEHDIDEDYFELRMEGDYKFAGENNNCYLYVRPKENVEKNYCWENGEDVSAVEILFHIEKAQSPDYSEKAAEISQKAVITTTYYTGSFEYDVRSLSRNDETVKKWLEENLNFTDRASVEMAEKAPDSGNIITDSENNAVDKNDYKAGVFYVWVDYNPDTMNYSGSSKIKIKLVIEKQDIRIIYSRWHIGNGDYVPLNYSWYSNWLDCSSVNGITTTYYRANNDDEYAEVTNYQLQNRIGYYKTVLTYEINKNNFNLTLADKEYNGLINEVDEGFEFISEWRIYNPYVQDQGSKFIDIKLLHADGTELTEEELADDSLGDYPYMTESLRESNLENQATANFQLNYTVSGTCDFSAGTFDELIESGEPYYYKEYNSTEEDKFGNKKVIVEVYLMETDENGESVQGFTLKGSRYGDIITLTTEVPELSGFIWQFVFEVTEVTLDS